MSVYDEYKASQSNGGTATSSGMPAHAGSVYDQYLASKKAPVSSAPAAPNYGLLGTSSSTPVNFSAYQNTTKAPTFQVNPLLNPSAPKAASQVPEPPALVKTQPFAPPAPTFQFNPQLNDQAQSHALIEKAGNALDRTSGAIISPMAGTPLEKNGLPQKFSEQVTGGATEAFGPKYGPAIGLGVAMIGDPLNFVGGGEAKAGKILYQIGKIPIEESAQLLRAAEQIKAGKLLQPKDWGTFKRIFNDHGYEVPETQNQASQMVLDHQQKFYDDVLDKPAQQPATGGKQINPQPKPIQPRKEGGLWDTFKKTFSSQKGFVMNPFAPTDTSSLAKSISDHYTSMNQVLTEMPEEYIRANGGMSAQLAKFQQNVVRDLQSRGLDVQASAVDSLNPRDVNTKEAFLQKVYDASGTRPAHIVNETVTPSTKTLLQDLMGSNKQKGAIQNPFFKKEVPEVPSVEKPPIDIKAEPTLNLSKSIYNRGFIKNPFASAAPEEGANRLKGGATPESSANDSTRIPPTGEEKGLLSPTDTTAPRPSIPETPGVKGPTTPGQSQGLLESSLPGTLPQKFNPDKYVAEQVQKATLAKDSGAGLLSKSKSFLANAKSKLVDFTAPIEDTLYAATEKSGITLKPTEDIHNQIDRVLRAPTLAGQFAKDHGIVDVIRKVDNPDALDQYLIAKHAIELDTRGITTGRDIGKDTALVKALAPQYEKDAQTIAKYSQSLLDQSVETGLINKTLADTLKKRYPDYVPFQRVFNEIEKANGYNTGAVASLSKQSVVQSIEGSTREIESPIQSLLAKTNDVFKQGEKNVAGKLLAGYEKLPGNPFKLRELEKGETAQHTISYLDQGVKRTFETTPEIADAAKALNVQQLNVLGKIFALPTRIARVGITGINLPFIGANIAKDQVTGFINSSNALRTSVANVPVFMKSLFNAVGHGELYQEMVRAGGAGTSFDISRNQVENTVASIRASRSAGAKILYTVRHPSELLRTVENIVARGEEMTRLQQYAGTKEGLLAKGMESKDAITGAARAARDNTVNFARRGEWGSVLNSAFLYLNANIQGTRTLLRNLQSKPGQTAAKIAITSLFPVATATAWNLSDPTRKKAYEDISDYEKQNNIIIVPPNPTQDEQGKWNVIKVPLSQEINNLVGAARRSVEAAHGEDPVTFKDFAGALLGTVSPINPTTGSLLSTLTPQAIKPTIEVATNKNLFTGRPIVSQGLENLSPKNQYKPYTSGTARLIGEKLNISPLKAEAFIKETFGGVGSQALNAVDQALTKTGTIPEGQVGGQNILSSIMARFNKAQGGEIQNKEYEQTQQQNQQHLDDVFKTKENVTKTGETQKVGNTYFYKTKDGIQHTTSKNVADAKVLYEKLKDLPKDEANAQAAQVARTDPKVFQELKSIVAFNKLSPDEQEMTKMGVASGERARTIYDKVLQLSSREEKNAYIKDLQEKKVITKEVLQQLKQLIHK